MEICPRRARCAKVTARRLYVYNVNYCRMCAAVMETSLRGVVMQRDKAIISGPKRGDIRPRMLGCVWALLNNNGNNSYTVS